MQADRQGSEQIFACLWSRFKHWRRQLIKCDTETSNFEAESIFSLKSMLSAKEWIYNQSGIEYDFQYTMYHYAAMSSVIDRKKLKELLCDRSYCQKHRSSAISTVCVLHRDVGGRLALHHAVIHRQFKLIEYLLRRKDARIQLHMQDAQGATPFHHIFTCMTRIGRKIGSIESQAVWKQYSLTADTMLALVCENWVSLFQVRDNEGRNIAMLDWKTRGGVWDCFRSGNVSRLKLLIQTYGERVLGKGCRIQLKYLQRTGLHEACERNQSSILVYLLEKVSDQRRFIDQRDTSGCTALHYAAMRGSLSACLLILGDQSDSDHDCSLILVQDHAGRTALHWSLLRSCHIEVAKVLAERCPEAVQIVDHDGLTLLHLAIHHGQVELVKILISFGANVNAVMSFHTNTFIVSEVSSKPSIKSWKSLDKEKKPDQYIKQSLSPLTFTIRCGFKLCLKGYSASLLAITEVLLWAGALPNGSSFEKIQFTPLSEVFRCLTRFLVQGEAEQAIGDTCIMILRLLLSHGAKRYAADNMEQLILTLSMQRTNEKREAFSWSEQKKLSNGNLRNLNIQTQDDILPQLLVYIDPVSHSIYHGMLWQSFMLQSFQVLIIVQEIRQNQSLAIDTRARIEMPSQSRHSCLWDVLYSQAVASWDEERRCFKISKLYRHRLSQLEVPHLLFLQKQYQAQQQRKDAGVLPSTATTLQQLFLFCKRKWLTCLSIRKLEASHDRRKLVQVLLGLRQLLAYENSAQAENIRWSCCERTQLAVILISFDTACWLSTSNSIGILDILWELVVERLRKLKTENLLVLDRVLSNCPNVIGTAESELYARRWLCRLQACVEASECGENERTWMLSAQSILYACAWNFSRPFIEQTINLFLQVTHDAANSSHESSVLDVITGDCTLNGHNAIGWVGLHYRWDLLSLMLGYARGSISIRCCSRLLGVMARLSSCHEINARMATSFDWVAHLDDAGALYMNDHVPTLLKSSEECLRAACTSIIQQDSLILFDYLFDKVWLRNIAHFRAYADGYCVDAHAISFVGHLIQCNANRVLGRCIELAQDVSDEPYSQWFTEALLNCDSKENCFTISQQFGFWKLKRQLIEYFNSVVSEKSTLSSNILDLSKEQCSLPSSLPGFFHLLMSLHASCRRNSTILQPTDKKERRESRQVHLESLQGSLQIVSALDLDTHLEAFQLQGWLHIDRIEVSCLARLIQTAIRNGSVKVLNWLVQHTEHTDLALAKFTPGDAQLLWTAVLQHDSLLYAEMTEKLLCHGLPLGRIHGDGSDITILHRVATYSNRSHFQRIVKLLKMRKHLDWNVLDAMGNTPIVYAMASGWLYNACVLCAVESVRLEAEYEGQSAVYYSCHLLPNCVWRYIFQQLLMDKRHHAYLQCEVEDCGCKGFEVASSSATEQAQCGACEHAQSHHTILPFPPWYLDQCDSYRCPFTTYQRITAPLERDHVRLSDENLLQIAAHRFGDIFAEFKLTLPKRSSKEGSETHCCIAPFENGTPNAKAVKRHREKHRSHRSIMSKVRRWSGKIFLQGNLTKEAGWSVPIEDESKIHSRVLSSARADLSMLHPASCRCQQSTMCINKGTWMYYCISRWLRRMCLNPRSTFLTREVAFHLWRSNDLTMENLASPLSPSTSMKINWCIDKWQHVERNASFRQWKRSILSNKRLQEQTVGVAESLTNELSQSRLRRLQKCQRLVERSMHECTLTT